MDEKNVKQIKRLIQEKEAGVTEQRLNEIMDNIRAIMGNFKTVDLEIPEYSYQTPSQPNGDIEYKPINTTNIELVFDNVEALKRADLSLGQIVRTYGYYNKLDGGEARYVIVDNHIADEKCSFKLDNGLVAKLVMVNNTCNIKQFGAKGNEIDDETELIQYIFNYVGELGGGIIHFPKGRYKVTKMIRLKYSNISLIGDFGNRVMYYGIGGYEKGTESLLNEIMFLIMGSNLAKDCIHDILIDGLVIDCTNQWYKGGKTKDDPKTTSINPYFHCGLTAIRPQNVYKMKIKNCQIIDCYGNGIAVDRSSHVDIVDNFLLDCSGNGFGGGNGGDVFGDGIGCWKSSHCSVRRNCVINTRTFLTHEISCNRDVYGYPCGRSGLEFEYPINIDVQGNPEYWTPMALTKTTVDGCNLLFEDNVVYGYTKGCHLEYGVSCQVLNNTFIHNHISFLDATGGNTIVSGNYFDPDGIDPAVQGGYDWYWRCGVAFTHFLGQWFDNAIVDGNIFVGDQTGVQIGRSKVTIQNNIFRQTGGNCIGARIGWASEINIQNNEFSSPDWKSCPGQFIGLSGVNIHINNNTFEVHEGLLGKLAISCGSGSQFCHNTLRNVEMGVNADLVEGNSVYNVLPEGTNLIDIGRGRVVKNNSYWISGGAGYHMNCHTIEDNVYYYENMNGRYPSIGIGDYSLLHKCIIKGNVLETKEPMKDFWINLDGRIDPKTTIDILIEDNDVCNYDKDFNLFNVWNNGKDYHNVNIICKNNRPNKYKLNHTINTPLTGNYYTKGEKISTHGEEEAYICTKTGYYSYFEWDKEETYKYNKFVLDEGRVYKCISDKNLKSDKKPSEDHDNWENFGEVATFEKIKIIDLIS